MARAWVFGDNISTDDIIAGKYLVKCDPKELAAHVMENIAPDFPKKIRPGDIIVAGRNFGCGSSREHAPLALKAAGISAVVAESFARIFYRNSINLGFPVLTSKVRGEFESGDEVELDLEKFVLRNLRSGKVISLNPLPPFILDILRAGGLIEYMKRK
jgi:3-isopropylmalate/(R)-2-methylmalate dehydratase small subunit